MEVRNVILGMLLKDDVNDDDLGNRQSAAAAGLLQAPQPQHQRGGRAHGEPVRLPLLLPHASPK